jgi:acyl-ACP thioesterase
VAVSARIEQPYRVRFDEAGPDGILRSSGLLRFAQDIAWLHSEQAGFGRRWYAEHGLTWLVRGAELDILEHVQYGSRLTVSTEVVGFRRVWARRRSEFTLDGGERPVAIAIIDWVLLNRAGRPARVPAEIVQLFDSQARTTFTPLDVQLPATPADAWRGQLTVRHGELDPMGHVNNAAYIDYVDAHLLAAGRSPSLRRVPRRYRLEFIASARPDQRLVGNGWEDGPAWCYRLESDDRVELLRARLEAELASWVGG